MKQFDPRNPIVALGGCLARVMFCKTQELTIDRQLLLGNQQHLCQQHTGGRKLLFCSCLTPYQVSASPLLFSQTRLLRLLLQSLFLSELLEEERLKFEEMRRAESSFLLLVV